MTQTSQQSTSDEALQKATGKGWQEWFTLLDKAGAKEMSHKDIARWLYDQKLVESGWWCQSITVGYEQHIGRRDVGQQNDGSFQTAASKTLAGSLDSVLELWLKKVEGVKAFNRVPLTDTPKVNKTEKWRYWHGKLADNSRVAVIIGKKGDDKIQLAITHEKIQDKTAAAEWQTYWKAFIGEL